MLQHRVEALLLADGGEGLVADAGAAQRSCAVAGMHLDPLVEHQELLEERIMEIAGKAPGLFLAEQIRAADRADKQRVAAEDPGRLVLLIHQDREVFRRVPGRVHELDRDVADAQPLTMRRFVVRIPKMRSGSGDGLGADSGQLAGSAGEVRVDVRLEGVGDAQAL